MITEEKRCSQCSNVINYGLHAVKSECKFINKIWYNYTGENNNRNNAKNCEHFHPEERVWSHSEQKLVKSKDVNWI